MATIFKLSDGIAVENDSLRLTFPLTGGLVGKFSLYARKGDRFDLAATCSPLSEICYRTHSGAAAIERITTAGYEMDRRGGDCILRLESQFHDSDGVRWSSTFEFYVPDKGPRVTITSRLATNRPAALLAFRAPFLRVPNDSRTSGLFPGLDWVIAGEKSSSPDTAPPPFDRRTVPHPYKITVPVMAIERNGTVTGIAWDPLQVWDGERVEATAHRYPAAVFASPEADAPDTHLMGLFAPSVPEFVDENNIIAARPYQMTPGREIQLECNIFALDSSNVLDALREHIYLNGLVPPPPKTRDYKENLELDIETYIERAWSPSHSAWAQSSSADEKWTFYSELVALALWRASFFAKAPELKRRMRENVEAAVAAHGGTGGVWLAYFRGGLRGEIELQAGQLDKLVRTQQPNGGWVPEDLLAQKREKPLMGVTAEHAAKLLRSALITGNRPHLDAGIKAIRFLDGHDRPAGMRVWDVHPQAPDILAAAHSLSAYLDEYLITGNPGRLERAVYWAWAGLPFLYLWHAHNRQVMRYASVPFFGISSDKHAMFGVAAQWNGLIYAKELLRLSRVDRSLNWHRIARAITLCAMQFQHTDPKLAGFYPEAYSIVDDKPLYALSLNPQHITRNVMMLLGEDVEPMCEVVPWQEKRSRVATVARMLAIRSSPHQIAVRLAFPAGESCRLTLAECEKPVEVRIGDAKIERQDDLAQVHRGWVYDEATGLSIVKITFAQPEEVVEFRF